VTESAKQRLKKKNFLKKLEELNILLKDMESRGQ